MSVALAVDPVTAETEFVETVPVPGALRRMGPLVRPYRHIFLGALLLSGVGMVCDILTPVLTAAIVDGPIAHRDAGALALPVSGVAVLAGCSAVSSWWRRRIIAAPAAELEVGLRAKLFRRLQVLSVGAHDGLESGQLTSRAVTDLSMLRRFFAFGAPTLLALGATVILGVLVLFLFSWQIGVVESLVAVPLVALATRFEKSYGRAARRAQDKSGDLATIVEESAQGIRVLKAFGRGPWFGRRFEREAEALRGLQLEITGLAARLWTALNLLSALGIAAALAVGGYLETRHQMTIGTLVAGITLATFLQWPIMGFGFLLAEMNQARAAAERYWEIIDTPLDIEDPERPVPPPAPLRGELRFENVSFCFPDADYELLKDVSLALRPGEIVAVVGATGSGKSALLALVPRLYDVTGGAVTVAGVDVRSLRTAELRGLVSVAFEEPVLFSASVRENITLGFPDADADRVRTALEVAQAADFVADLPWGLNTRIGEQGLSLSGGQRQRLALARAVLDRSKHTDGHIVVLDDPLSALDVTTEEQVQRRLRTALDGATVLLVAHRPSTAAWADRVAVLDEGRIIADGPHEQLLQTCPRYRELMGGTDEDSAATALTEVVSRT
ncbi:ABC transporter ATP-binding protein [Nocardia stercoris]|uniref:ABC transporter ATP-binding protein n=1 Tax=Nocardia stercoris TaxID=2483361 RepID=UPI001F3ABD8D|nr:ABC transporter ATP-binding protein [Nocardia stercoris]